MITSILNANLQKEDNMQEAQQILRNAVKFLRELEPGVENFEVKKGKILELLYRFWEKQYGGDPPKCYGSHPLFPPLGQEKE